MRAAVVGATGYAGAEILRLLAMHPHVEVVLATGATNAGVLIAEHVPALAAAYPTLVAEPTESVLSTECDVAFVALPHGASQALVPALLDRGVRVVDLGADFRLTNPQDYPTWYGHEHTVPSLLSRAVYGLVERHRDELVGAELIAVPGCYPTATNLALAPFVDAGLLARRGVVVNALSGASGAGRATSDRLHFSRLSGSAEAYGLSTHRHTAEMQQELGVEVLFTPHLVPVARGMLVTATAPLVGPLDTASAIDLLQSTYANDPCVVVTTEPPTLKDPLGSNLCFVSAVVDERTGTLIAMSSLDNLVKGAAGQAVQCFNIAVGFPETTGLPLVGVTP